MIRPLRKRHRTMVTVLAVILPVVAVVGVILRKPPIVTDNTQLPRVIEAEAFPHQVWAKNGFGDDFPDIRIRLLSDDVQATQFAVELSIPKQVTRPDVLVYWSEHSTVDDESSTLLGAFRSSAATIYPLPTSAEAENGVLMLYSLAHQQIVAAIPFPKVRGDSQ